MSSFARSRYPRGARRVRGHLPRVYLDRAKEDIRHGKEEEAPSRGTGRSRYARDVATAFAADRLNVRQPPSTARAPFSAERAASAAGARGDRGIEAGIAGSGRDERMPL